MISEPPPLRIGQSFGRYELLTPIARGGMGQVWAARLRGARGFQKLVAIKTLLPAPEDKARLEGMLFEEARIAGMIQHANVVQTLELGEDCGTLYLVMEWVDGEPLSYLMKSCEGTGVPLLVAVNLIAQALHGLQAAHELCDESGATLGVVHRDVSPHNLLVSYTGVAKLVDFGIAKAMNQASSSTDSGEIKGKFAYMAPEQVLAGEVDQRADLFSIGIILYRLTTGRHPFNNHDPASVLHSITSEDDAPRPSLLTPAYSRTLEAVVMKSLEKDRTRRWSSAAEMRLALLNAVPDAFAVGIEGAVEAFMTSTVGQRAAEKREALRVAEQRSARRRSSSGTLSGVGRLSPSVSSLRAFAVDNAALDGERLGPRPSAHPTLQPGTEQPATLHLGTAKLRAAWPFAAALAAALLLAIVSFRAPGHAPHASAAGGASLPTPTRESLHLLRSAAAVALPPPAASAVAAPSATTIAASASSVGKPRSKPSKAPHASEASDLIAPDYAR